MNGSTDLYAQLYIAAIGNLNISEFLILDENDIAVGTDYEVMAETAELIAKAGLNRLNGWKNCSKCVHYDSDTAYDRDTGMGGNGPFCVLDESNNPVDVLAEPSPAVGCPFFKMVEY